MGNSEGLDGRIDYIDTKQLEKLIGQLREKVIHQVAQSRYHYELAIGTEKRLKKAEARLSELRFETINKE